MIDGVGYPVLICGRDTTNLCYPGRAGLGCSDRNDNSYRTVVFGIEMRLHTCSGFRLLFLETPFWLTAVSHSPLNRRAFPFVLKKNSNVTSGRP